MAWHLSDGWQSCPEPSLEEPDDFWPCEEQPVCPICGRECDFFIVDRMDGVIGCEYCTRQVSAWSEVYGA